MSMNYTVEKDGYFVRDVEGLNVALGFAEKLLNEMPSGMHATYTVQNEDGYLLAAVTNRRIVGVFNKQEWGGRKGNDAIYIGSDTFDATDAVLLLEHRHLVNLRDSDESSDMIGRDHVEWSGPCYVWLEEAVKAYFGVHELAEITPEALAYARQRANPQEPNEETLTLGVNVKLRIAPGASATDFLEVLDCVVRSRTPGVVVVSSEINEVEPQAKQTSAQRPKM